MQHQNYISIDISIVIYETDEAVLTKCLNMLTDSIRYAKSKITGLDAKVHLVINDEIINEKQLDGYKFLLDYHCINIKNAVYYGHGNLGYGRGHNIAIGKSKSDIFLVLNPDVFMEKSAIYNGIVFLGKHKEVSLVSPLVVNQNNKIQYLCKRYPSITVLFLRMFFPFSSVQIFRRILDDYEMRDIVNEHDTVFNIPIVSGCFMLFDTSTLKHLGGFSENYFMYFEDYDLSLRTAALSKISYYPKIKITHLGGGASKKGIEHIKIFIASAFRFFNSHGWKLY